MLVTLEQAQQSVHVVTTTDRFKMSWSARRKTRRKRTTRVGLLQALEEARQCVQQVQMLNQMPHGRLPVNGWARISEKSNDDQTTGQPIMQLCDHKGRAQKIVGSVSMATNHAFQVHKNKSRHKHSQAIKVKHLFLIVIAYQVISDLFIETAAQTAQQQHKNYIANISTIGDHQEASTQVSSNNSIANSQSFANLINRVIPPLKVPSSFNSHRNYDQMNLKTTYACEGKQMELSCSEGKLIHLVRANYGRFSLSICNENGHSNYSVICTSFRAFLDVQTMCNKLTNCSVTVSRELFGDPCEGTSKYLEVQYYCYDANNRPSGTGRVIGSATDGGDNSTGVSQYKPIPAGPSATAQDVSRVTNQQVSGQWLDNGSSDSQQQQQHLIKTSDWRQTTSTAPVIYPRVDQCAPQTSARNLLWNATRLGQLVHQDCPDGAKGRVSWLCDPVRNSFSPPTGPDFSQCHSIWLERLNVQLERMLEMSPMEQRNQNEAKQANAFGSGEFGSQQDEQMIKSILGELCLMARTKSLFGQDLKRIELMIGQMLAQLRPPSRLFNDGSVFNASYTSGSSRGAMNGELFAKILQLMSSLFDASQRRAWLDMESPEKRQQIQWRLLNRLKEAGLLLANTLTDRQLASMVPIKQTNLMALIRPLTIGINDREAPEKQFNQLPATDVDGTNIGEQISREPDLRLAKVLIDELVNKGFTKLLVIEILRPDFVSIENQQLEQQSKESELVGFQSAARQNALIEQTQQHIIGIFPLHDNKSHYQDQQQGQEQVPRQFEFSSKRHNEQYLAWPISIEFKRTPMQNRFRSDEDQTGINRASYIEQSSEQNHKRKCLWIGDGLSLDVEQQANGIHQHQCRIVNSNATSTSCLCQRFGFVVLIEQQNSQQSSRQAHTPDDNFQWHTTGEFDLTNRWVEQQITHESRSLNDQLSYVINKQQQQIPYANGLSFATTGFIVMGVGLLVLTICGLTIKMALGLISKNQSFGKTKHQRPYDGSTTGPLVINHNQSLGSSGPINGSAQGQSSSTRMANRWPMSSMETNQLCVDQKPQQLYQRQLYAHSSVPVMQVHSLSNTPTASSNRTARFIRWLSNQANNLRHNSQKKNHFGAINDKAAHLGPGQLIVSTMGYGDQLHSVVPSESMLIDGRPLGGRILNGYTSSIALRQQFQGAQLPVQAQSGGIGQVAPPATTSSSNSSCISTSAYYEEISAQYQIPSMCVNQQAANRMISMQRGVQELNNQSPVSTRAMIVKDADLNQVNLFANPSPTALATNRTRNQQLFVAPNSDGAFKQQPKNWHQRQ